MLTCEKSLGYCQVSVKQRKSEWFCAPVQKFWLKVCEDLSTWLKCSIPACPTLCILGDFDNINMKINSAHMVLTVLCDQRAALQVLQGWLPLNFNCSLLENIEEPEGRGEGSSHTPVAWLLPGAGGARRMSYSAGSRSVVAGGLLAPWCARCATPQPS